jgi:hypothetical protein
MFFEDDSHHRCGDTSIPKGRSGGMRSPDGIDPVEGRLRVLGWIRLRDPWPGTIQTTGLEKSSVIK